MTDVQINDAVILIEETIRKLHGLHNIIVELKDGKLTSKSLGDISFSSAQKATILGIYVTKKEGIKTGLNKL